MPFRDEIAKIYSAHGSRHLLPFIGEEYDAPQASTLRIAVMGINAYISEDDWPANDDELRAWFHGWWANAGHGETYPFYTRAYREADTIARVLGNSRHFKGLHYDATRDRKIGYYAMNAIKVFTSDEYKTSPAIPDEYLQSFAPSWHAELDTMAKYGVLPHLIVVLGEKLWGFNWQAFYRDDPETFPQYKYLQVHEYVSGSETDNASYHHANRIRASTASGEQNVLLVRLHHPSSRSKVRRDAKWLLAQADFRRLAGLSDE